MKTAIVMSKEEAMSLPLKKRPICFRLSSEMYHKVWESIGNASHLGDKPEQLSDVAVDLLLAIANEKESFVPEPTQPCEPKPSNIVWTKFGDHLPGWDESIFVKTAFQENKIAEFFGKVTAIYETKIGPEENLILESDSVLKRVSLQDLWRYE